MVQIDQAAMVAEVEAMYAKDAETFCKWWGSDADLHIRYAIPKELRDRCEERFINDNQSGAFKPDPAKIPASTARGQKVLDRVNGERYAVPRFPKLWFDDARFDPEADYFIKGLFHGKRLIVVYGPSGEGKTFWVIDAVCHIATEMSYRGRRVRGGLWGYVAAEAGASIDRRIYAWANHHLSDSREGRVPLVIITRAANLLNSVEVEALKLELRAIEAEVGMKFRGLVFDTLSRSSPGGKEDAEHMTCMVGISDQIRDEFGASTVFVHHAGKDVAKGARGHSSLFAAADTVICVADRVATVEKSRDGATGDQFPFALEVVELGTDSDGDPITTCVVRATDEAPVRPKALALSGVAKVALQALQEAISEQGEPLPGTSTIPPGVRAVTMEAWRSRFAIRYGSDGDDRRDASAIRKAFQRGREGLLKACCITISNPYVWTTRAI